MVTLLLICTTPQTESFGKGGTPELISDKGMQTVFKKVPSSVPLPPLVHGMRHPRLCVLGRDPLHTQPLARGVCMCGEYAGPVSKYPLTPLCVVVPAAQSSGCQRLAGNVGALLLPPQARLVHVAVQQPVPEQGPSILHPEARQHQPQRAHVGRARQHLATLRCATGNFFFRACTCMFKKAIDVHT